MSAVRSRQHPPNSLFSFVVLISHSGRSKHRLGVVVQLVRIPACHAGGRGFESRPLRQHKKCPSPWRRAFFCTSFCCARCFAARHSMVVDFLAGLARHAGCNHTRFGRALAICITAWPVQPKCCPRESAGRWFSSPWECPWIYGLALLAEYSQRAGSACLRSACHP